MGGYSWSEEDINIVKENYDKMTYSEIVPLLSTKRTVKAIKHILEKLELKKINNYEEIKKEDKYKTTDGITYKICKCCRRYLPLDFKYFPKDNTCLDGFRNVCKECKGDSFVISDAHIWTDEEIIILKDNYSIKTNTELINEYFSYLTIDQIRDKAYALDLYKNKEVNSRTHRESVTPETRYKISQLNKTRGYFKGENNPMYGSHRIGKLNPNWKGGKRTEKEIFMATEEYKQWRKAIFERDNYTCQCCGKATHNNEAHHIENFADNPELRLDINNGITLCKKCHNPNQVGSFHNTYGTLHNNVKQLNDYIQNYKANLINN